MQVDKKWLSRAAAQEGFVRDTLEKVYRLTRVLQYINSNPCCIHVCKNHAVQRMAYL